MTGIWPWVTFNTGVLVILAIDLGVFNRKTHVVSVREAAVTSAVWIVLALLFAGWIVYAKGQQSGVEFLTGYLIEYSLSIDNIFIFVLIFAYFKVQAEYQHRILFWGIIGALLMRGAMIGAGALLIERFEWVTYIFGAFLVFTGVKMAFQGEQEIDPETNPVLRIVRHVIPISPANQGKRFFVRQPDAAGRLRTSATPLFIVLVLVETTDLIFAVDSIPAVFAVTRDPFIVYTSNVCAILGLRSLYFLLAGVIDRFHHLKYGLAIVLTYVGVKMLIAGIYEVPTWLSLVVIFVVLGGSIATSLAFPERSADSNDRV